MICVNGTHIQIGSLLIGLHLNVSLTGQRTVKVMIYLWFIHLRLRRCALFSHSPTTFHSFPWSLGTDREWRQGSRWGAVAIPRHLRLCSSCNGPPTPSSSLALCSVRGMKNSRLSMDVNMQSYGHDRLSLCVCVYVTAFLHGVAASMPNNSTQYSVLFVHAYATSCSRFKKAVLQRRLHRQCVG